MKTESSYIYEEPAEAQGLGRMPTQPAMLRPILDEPALLNRTQQIRPRILPRSIPIPKPDLNPRPVIDKNPVPAPKLIVNTVKKATTKKSQTAKTQNKSTNKQQTSSNDILSGSFNIGGFDVKKTHAAMAGGGIAGGLLLWKILF